MANEDKDIYLRFFKTDLSKRIGQHKLKTVIVKEEPIAGFGLSIWLISKNGDNYFTQIDLDELLRMNTGKALDRIAYICAITWSEYVKIIRGEK